MPGIIAPGAAAGVGPAGNPQVTFANSVAAQTGLDPRVVYAWTVAEGATAPNGTGHFNFLNLKPFPGDPSYGQSPGGFEQFGSVDKAVAATVRRLKQPFAKGIVGAAGQSPVTQIRAIAESGWDQNHYSGTFNGKSGIGGGLLAKFASLFGAKSLPADASTQPLPPAGGGASSDQTSVGGQVGGAISGALSGVLAGFEGGALRVGLYLIFTVVALGMIVLAIDKASGGATRIPLSEVALGRKAAEKIPF